MSPRPKPQFTKSEKPAVKRKNGRFLPGQSGNPGGVRTEYREIIALGRQWSVELMHGLHRLATTSKNELVRIHATEAILNRTFGRPKQVVDFQGGVEHSFVLRAPALVVDAKDWEARWGDRPPDEDAS